jgi:hypothetical protein
VKLPNGNPSAPSPPSYKPVPGSPVTVAVTVLPVPAAVLVTALTVLPAVPAAPVTAALAVLPPLAALQLAVGLSAAGSDVLVGYQGR